MKNDPGAAGSLEQVESAIHELRANPSQLFFYYAGTVPFLVVALFAFAELIRNRSAAELIAPSAAALLLAFVWMKILNAVFMEKLRASVAGLPTRAWSFIDIYRVIRLQVPLQMTGLVMIPLALLFGLPFVWVFSFYQCLAGSTDLRGGSLKDSLQRAIRAAAYQPLRNHRQLLALAVFGFCILVNVTLGLYTVPQLVHTLLGVDTSMAHVGWRILLDPVFWGITAAITFALFDPVIKATYALWLFQSEAVSTAEDIRAELRTRRSSGAVLVTAVFLVLAVPCPAATPTRENQAARRGVQNVELQEAIRETLQQREYQWRLPRAVEETSSSRSWIEQMALDFKKWITDLLDRWFPDQSKKKDAKLSSREAWPDGLRFLLVALALAAVAATVILLLRAKKRRTQASQIGIVLAPAVDPLSERIKADDLPEDRWLALSDEMMARGDLRQAARALYFAALAHLASRGLVAVAHFKSNSEYRNEVQRRARAWPDVQEAFSDSIGIFDRIWYGWDEVTEEWLGRMKQNAQRIRAC